MELTQERLRELVDYDPSTGQFTWKVTRKNAPKGRTLGRKGNKGHLRVMINGRYYMLTTLAHLWMTGEWPAATVRHRDGDKTNHRWSNLREAPNGQPYCPRLGPSGYRGVTAAGRRWCAKVKIDGKYKSLGYFDTVEEAHACVVAHRQSFP